MIFSGAKMQPLISIISTFYNCDKYICQSVESILSQTYANFEFIIINDGSTDKTVEKINFYKDSRIIFINHEDNKGIARRRNEAIFKANGKYACVHDGDDISLPNRLEKQCEFLENNNSIFCVGTHAIKINENGDEIGMMDYPPVNHDEIVKMFGGIISNPIIDSSSMFRIKDFNNLGGYSMEANRYLIPDLDLWMRALTENKIFANIPQPLIRYRVNPDGMTQKYKRKMIYQHFILTKMYRLFLNRYFLNTKGTII